MFSIIINPNNKEKLNNLLNTAGFKSDNLKSTLRNYLYSVDNVSFETREAANLARIGVLEGITSLAFTTEMICGDYDKYRIFTAIYLHSLTVRKVR